MTSPRTFAALLLALVVAVSACTGAPGTSSTPSVPSPTASAATAACPIAPEVSDADAQAWLRAATSDAVLPVIASSQQVCGANRILIGLLDPDNRSLAAPERTLEVAFFDLGRDADQPATTADGEFVWAIEGSRGLYVVNAELGESGVWGAEIRTAAESGAEPEVVRVGFQVHPTGITKRVGEPAPASVTPTASDVEGDLAQLSTDAEPDPRLYETSVDAALAAQRPFVLVFATPKFCASAVCGPTLDKVKPFIDDFADVTFINVEPYELEPVDGQLQPVLTDGQLTPVPSVGEWGLLTEPWIFVVDAGGTIRGSFEGAIGEAELRRALESLG